MALRRRTVLSCSQKYIVHAIRIPLSLKYKVLLIFLQGNGRKGTRSTLYSYPVVRRFS